MQINGTLILLYFKELTNRVRYQSLHIYGLCEAGYIVWDFGE